MKVTLSFSIDTKRDEIMTQWLDRQRNKSESIRGAIYAQMEYEEVGSPRIVDQMNRMEAMMGELRGMLQIPVVQVESTGEVPPDIIENMKKLG